MDISSGFTAFTRTNEKWKIEKLVANLHYKTEYVIHIKNSKEALNHQLILKKFIDWLNLNAWLKRYIDMNVDVRKKTKMIAKKTFLKILNLLQQREEGTI